MSLIETPGKETSFAKLSGPLTLERWHYFASNCNFLLAGAAANRVLNRLFQKAMAGICEVSQSEFAFPFPIVFKVKAAS